MRVGGSEGTIGTATFEILLVLPVPGLETVPAVTAAAWLLDVVLGPRWTTMMSWSVDLASRLLTDVSSTAVCLVFADDDKVAGAGTDAEPLGKLHPSVSRSTLAEVDKGDGPAALDRWRLVAIGAVGPRGCSAVDFSGWTGLGDVCGVRIAELPQESGRGDDGIGSNEPGDAEI